LIFHKYYVTIDIVINKL